jgi:hypothetical protein
MYCTKLDLMRIVETYGKYISHEYSWFRELVDIDKVQLQKFEFFIVSVS